MEQNNERPRCISDQLRKNEEEVPGGWPVGDAISLYFFFQSSFCCLGGCFLGRTYQACGVKKEIELHT